MQRRTYRRTTGGVAAADLAALLLSAIGLYAVVAFSVGQRKGEIAVRMAVGARYGQIVRKFLGDGLRLSAYGLALGLPGGGHQSGGHAAPAVAARAAAQRSRVSRTMRAVGAIDTSSSEIPRGPSPIRYSAACPPSAAARVLSPLTRRLARPGNAKESGPDRRARSEWSHEV